jgi:hypothetical protein
MPDPQSLLETGGLAVVVVTLAKVLETLASKLKAPPPALPGPSLTERVVALAARFLAHEKADEVQYKNILEWLERLDQKLDRLAGRRTP